MKTEMFNLLLESVKERDKVAREKGKASLRDEEEQKFMMAVAHGLMEIQSGKERELNEVKKRLGIR